MQCSQSADPWVARAAIALGTFVEVRLRSSEASENRFAAAFAAIAKVQRRMSAHDDASDLARIARRAHRRPVAVDAQTFEVLSLALTLFHLSEGRFDITRGPRRVRGGTFDCVDLISPRHVTSRRPLSIDLGGLAKGYAVDRAVSALRASGVTQGVVNAGGDMRVFGAMWSSVRLRDPRNATHLLELGELRDSAVATSGDYFRGNGAALFGRGRGRPRAYASSVTVIAPTCALADALTKIVATDWRRAPRILARLRAQAIRLTADGDILCPYATAPVGGDRLRPAAPAAA
jgi:thiamine biosynthesis lipoprotein